MEEALRYADILLEEHQNVQSFEVKLHDREQFEQVVQALSQKECHVEADETSLFISVIARRIT
jgi:hypothetical protein